MISLEIHDESWEEGYETEKESQDRTPMESAVIPVYRG